MNRPVVRLVGASDEQTAYSSVNRRWNERLAPQFDLVTDEATTADVAIHQEWQVRFGTEHLPPARRRVAVRPWDFGPYPPRWVDVVGERYDELWVHSDWTARCAVEGGVDSGRVRVVPLGVDAHVHVPVGDAADVAPPSHVVLLFVGAAVVRKGVDLVLAAFTEAFEPTDPVSLVVKDNTADVFYEDQSRRDDIIAAAADPSTAHIVYLDAYLDGDELAALYRRADALVAPYRAEGFALPILEAMACGTVPIVPRFGACLDYCDERTALFVEPRRIALPIGRSYTTNSLGFDEVIDRVEFCETPVDRLAEAMRTAYAEGRDSLRGRGALAAQHARSWTWDRSAEAVVAAVTELVG